MNRRGGFTQVFLSKVWRYQIIVVDLQQNSIKRLKEGDKYGTIVSDD